MYKAIFNVTYLLLTVAKQFNASGLLSLSNKNYFQLMPYGILLFEILRTNLLSKMFDEIFDTSYAYEYEQYKL
jgi:hypothetical protein